jgi:pantoate--beta-alanine ligase
LLPIQVVKTIREMQDIAERLRSEGKKIAVVPTMGYLHGGHASLIERARQSADVVITTIFINPKQFALGEDLSRYPRDFDRDQIVAGDAGTDIIFFPDKKEMYPQEFNSAVEIEGVSKILEGAFRPTHYRGVTTVVAKLFNITKPHIAVFGQKDAQQAFIIKKMVRDLNFDVEIIVAPIVREADGLAMSSRNIYLNETERKNALVLSRSLRYVSDQILQGERSVSILRKEMLNIIQSGEPMGIDYIAFVDPATFSEIGNIEGTEILVLLAVRFGSTRLIDNSLIPISR